MNARILALPAALVLCLLASGPSRSQAPVSGSPPPVTAPPGPAGTSSSRDVPRPDELEPGVNTSAAPSDAGPANDAHGAGERGTAAQSSTVPELRSPTTPGARNDANARTGGGTRGTRPADTKPSPSANTASPAGGVGAARTGTRTTGIPTRNAAVGKAQDHIELDETQITGNRELPKVLYIVPWKRSDLGDLVGKPTNSLLDEVLAPIDRDVFRRENRYYDALQPDTGAAQAAGGAAGQAPAAPAAGPAPAERK